MMNKRSIGYMQSHDIDCFFYGEWQLLSLRFEWRDFAG